MFKYLIDKMRKRASLCGIERNVIAPNLNLYFMYQRLSRYRIADQRDARVLSISGSEKLCSVLGFSEFQIVKANFPQYNILDFPFSINVFDWVVSDQVLEHVEGNPQTAIDESLRVVKPGGIVVHTTVFIYPIHSGLAIYA